MRMLCWGRGASGQLGLLDSSEAREARPQPQAAGPASRGLLLSRPVAYVSCGGDFTLLLTSEGEVWACGANEHGQLGYPSIGHARPKPRRLLRANIAKIACGAQHAAAVSVAGDLYSWGLNSHGQLGVGHMRAVVPMRPQERRAPNNLHAFPYASPIHTPSPHRFSLHHYSSSPQIPPLRPLPAPLLPALPPPFLHPPFARPSSCIRGGWEPIRWKLGCWWHMAGR